MQFRACVDEDDQADDGCASDVTDTALWSSDCGGTIENGEFTAPNVQQDTVCTISASVLLDTGETITGTFELTVLGDDGDLIQPDARACGACGSLGIISWSLMLLGLLGLRAFNRPIGTRG